MIENERLKRQVGQFFTISNPFFLAIFYERFSLIPKGEFLKIVEPFAGSNNIIALINELTLSDGSFSIDRESFDVLSQDENRAPEYTVNLRDTISDFPSGFIVAITNPPYLAKNSASRRKLIYSYPEYEDLYQKCLAVMLENVQFVAAIIPESFITSGLFRSRIYAISSLTCKMFDDTDCPVCLAMFVPENIKNKYFDDNEDFFLYRMDKKLGTYLTVEKRIQDILGENPNIINWYFNDKLGSIGIICIDSTKSPTISFINGTDIPEDRIKPTSRSLTRVSGLPDTIDLSVFLSLCNEKLKEYREISNDIGLTSFKGLRDDSHYRRRLDFKTARKIMNSVFYSLTKD